MVEVRSGDRIGVGVGRVVDAGSHDLEMDVVVRSEDERDRFRGRRTAMFDGEHELTAVPPQVEERVGPGEEIAGAAEALAGSTGGSVLACVMDDDDRDIERALKLAEVAEQGGDLTGVVLIDAVQADKRIEDQEARHIGRDRLAQRS
ncbi:MAG: hypothetical protein WKG01_41895 [Kofleriaceae bacterium]